MEQLPHEFVYPTVTEIIIPHYVPEHDDFADTLPAKIEIADDEA